MVSKWEAHKKDRSEVSGQGTRKINAFLAQSDVADYRQE